MRYLAVVGGVLLLGLAFGAGAAVRASGGHRTQAALPAAAPDTAARPGPHPDPLPILGEGEPGPPAPATASATASAPLATTDRAAAPNTAVRSSPYGPSRLIIPALGINSTWIPLGWLPNGITMDSPPGPEDLGWYTFTAQPGDSSNAVFSGHVDWHTGAPALFEHLSDLGPGSEIDVMRADGRLVTYHVISSTWYGLYETPAAPIIAPSALPEVTLITCGGVFNQSRREYDQRLIVRAIADSP